MLLSDDAVEQAIITIATGRLLVYIDGTFIALKQPNNFIKQKADAIYECEFEKAKKDGLLERAALEKIVEERALFTEDDKKKLAKLESKLEAQRVLLGKTTVVKANQDRIKKVIDGLKFEISELTRKKTSKLLMSAEVRAHEERSLFLCWQCSYTEDGALFWPSYDSFKNTSHIDFRSTVFSRFVEFYSGFPLKSIRYIARHNLWRIRYVTSQKVTEDLFGVPTTEYSNDMLGLAYWSNYYDNIYQMMPEDRPSDAVIEDDDALDAYMKNYYEERNREAAARRSSNKTPGKLKAFDAEEVIVTASNELWRDIDYDKPREAQRVKNKIDLNKNTSKKKQNMLRKRQLQAKQGQV
jgi:hypothetical protein